MEFIKWCIIPEYSTDYWCTNMTSLLRQNHFDVDFCINLHMYLPTYSLSASKANRSCFLRCILGTWYYGLLGLWLLLVKSSKVQSFREEKEASDTYCEINFSGSRPETKLIVIHALNFKFCFQFSFLKAVQCYSALLILPSRALHKTGHQSSSIISKY